MKKALLLIVFLSMFLLTSCINNYEQLTLYKRKILRTNLLTQKFDNYDMDTTASQLLSSELRDSNYSFNKKTKLIYDTVFISTPSTITYAFDDDGKISSISYDFFFSKENTEQEIDDIYAECIKFFGYPDEGYTRKIYEYLHKSPKIIWLKNNAIIALEFYLDDNLVPYGKMIYQHTEWNGSDLSTFKLPFTINALGDRINTVVASESKKLSNYYYTTVGYSYMKDNLEWYEVNYIFKGQFLSRIDLNFFANDLSEKQMQTLVEDIQNLMRNEFATAAVTDKSNEERIDLLFEGEATSISLFVDKDKKNRVINSTVEFEEYY